MKFRVVGGLFFLPMFFLLLAGCGSSGSSSGNIPAKGEPAVGTCTLVNAGTTLCIDYPNPGTDYINAYNFCLNAGINSSHGTYNSAPPTSCATAGEVGKCVTFAGSKSEQDYHYLSGWTSSTAQAYCTQISGTYTGG